jgi:hypothetical protein
MEQVYLKALELDDLDRTYRWHDDLDKRFALPSTHPVYSEGTHESGNRGIVCPPCSQYCRKVTL